MPDFLSPKDLALAIGVSESSLKRWADEGLLNVSRTAGGHRRIALREAIRYIRKAGHPLVQPQVLGLKDLAAVPASHTTDARSDDDLIQALNEGNAEAVRGIVLADYLAGRSVADLCDGPLTAALHGIGILWRHGPEGIMVEHRAVDICTQALNQLQSVYPTPPANAPVAIGAALQDDPYSIPTLMVATVLGSAGWQAINLGPHLPLNAMRAAVAVHNPQVVWISCGLEDALRRHEAALRKTALQLTSQGIRVIVGGRGFKSFRVDEDGGILIARSMAEVAAFVRGARGALPDTAPAK